MKLSIKFNNVALEVSLKRLRERTHAGLYSMTEGGRQLYYQHVRTTEGAS
jgi:hypothetical protein